MHADWLIDIDNNWLHFKNSLGALVCIDLSWIIAISYLPNAPNNRPELGGSLTVIFDLHEGNVQTFVDVLPEAYIAIVGKLPKL